MELNHLSSQIIKAATNVHKKLGPGLLESVYQACMVIELRNLDLEYELEVPIPIVYQGEKVSDEGFRMDLLVENTIIAELESVAKIRGPQKTVIDLFEISTQTAWLIIKFQ